MDGTVKTPLLSMKMALKRGWDDQNTFAVHENGPKTWTGRKDLAPYEVEPVVEEGVGEEDADKEECGDPAGEEDECRDGPEQHENGHAEEPEGEPDRIAEGGILDLEVAHRLGRGP